MAVVDWFKGLLTYSLGGNKENHESFFDPSFYFCIFILWPVFLFSLNFFPFTVFLDRLCGLVVRVLGYRSGGPGSIPGTTRFS
jgi:hypothetical protein